MHPGIPQASASVGFLSNYPPEFARLGNRSQKCVGKQFVVVCFGAFAQDQVGSTRWLIVDRLEPATWEAHYDDIVLLNLDNEVR